MSMAILDVCSGTAMPQTIVMVSRTLGLQDFQAVAASATVAPREITLAHDSVHYPASNVWSLASLGELCVLSLRRV